LGLVPGVRREHYRQAIADTAKGGAAEANLALFDRLSATG